MVQRPTDAPTVPHEYLPPLRRVQFSLKDLLLVLTLNAVVWAMLGRAGGYVAAIQVGGLVTLGYLFLFCGWWEPLTRLDHLLYGASWLYVWPQLPTGFLSGFSQPGWAVAPASLWPLGMLCLAAAAILGMAWLLQIRWDSRVNAYQGWTRLAVAVACAIPMTFQVTRQQGISARLRWVGEEQVAHDCHQLMIRSKYYDIYALAQFAKLPPPTSIPFRREEFSTSLQRLGVDRASVSAGRVTLSRNSNSRWAPQSEIGYRYQLDESGEAYTLWCFDQSQHISWPVARGSTAFESRQPSENELFGED